ncbi:hypothetical protein IE53DRAFT_320669 [Violaceomyces palustris]|uniref:Uncharacterized protein n=1 Tax=Violaceomyces palustris TaxID=1673888 RepID=A0ACD0NPP2_9BASI|nr:hypothetical protein IE53DRAFT_320669 [Violaceomyces palustris]
MTPKKRAIPHEDIHCRNVPGYSPSKRSRSSKSGDGSSAAEGNTDPSTGTGSLATELSGFKMGESSRAVQGVRLMKRAVRSSHLKPTTTRIDKYSRMTEQEKILREKQKHEETKLWRHKFKKVFPSFNFYFDHFDEATAKDLTSMIRCLGGSVEPFFSRSVTHLITTRQIPVVLSENSDKGKESSLKSAKVGAAERTKELNRLAFKSSGKGRISPTKSAPDNFKNKSIPLYSERNPFDDSAPPPAANDILLKAQDFGMKIWRHDKLLTILKMLLDEPSVPAAAATGNKQDLSQMLEREKLFGTHERDPSAARGDYYYFPKNGFYLLVEDATMDHRPIMCAEYEYDRRNQEGKEPPWPVLYGELEGRCPFTKYDVTESHRSRLNRENNHQTLRRTVSLNCINQRIHGPRSPRPSNDGFFDARASAYQMASGNSVSITSNIASTTSNALNDHGGYAQRVPQNRRVTELGKRMHTPLVPSQSARISASPVGSGGSGLGPVAVAASGSGSSNPASPAASTTPISSLSRGALVRRMLGMTEHESKTGRAIPQGIRRSASASIATLRRREQDRRPGYCENCRVKYESFDDHIQSRKHRKFATDAGNFVDIDQLLLRVQRPLIPDWIDFSDATREDTGSLPDDEDELEDWERYENSAESAEGHNRHAYEFEYAQPYQTEYTELLEGEEPLENKIDKGPAGGRFSDYYHTGEVQHLEEDTWHHQVAERGDTPYTSPDVGPGEADAGEVCD